MSKSLPWLNLANWPILPLATSSPPQIRSEWIALRCTNPNKNWMPALQQLQQHASTIYMGYIYIFISIYRVYMYIYICVYIPYIYIMLCIYIYTRYIHTHAHTHIYIYIILIHRPRLPHFYPFFVLHRPCFLAVETTGFSLIPASVDHHDGSFKLARLNFPGS
jgi:hypothetical protein